MTPHESRLIGAGELALLGEVVCWADLAPDHLMRLRVILRDVRRWPDESDVQRLVRAELLNVVCRRIVRTGRASLDYFIGCGDAYPDAPDDTSELTGSVGGGE